MDIPQNEENARAHIIEIRASKAQDNTESDVSDLENTLAILAEQLYQKSTHFLLELIQNADDNNYKSSNPTLNITLSGHTLRIDCNEIGFTRRNTEAICSVGRSTKAGLEKSAGYIGEKGIGFKSIFKIADIVWIHSGHYSFMFDKNTKLGMIKPIWTAFPCLPKTGYTSMYLQLTDDCNVRELLNEIKSLDPRLLIFLHKLREVNITVHEEASTTWETKLSCQDVGTTNGEELVKLHQDDDYRLYKIIRHSFSGLPPEPRRPNCYGSQVVLAFLLGEFEGALMASQNVYAFLPIRDYGFKFLIQADFLLSASREDIDASSPWNQVLLENIPKAFVKAVEDFNSGDLRYTWIKFLQKRSPFSDFFSSLEESIVQALSDLPILESQSGKLMVPSKLRMVPATMLGDDEQPFVPTDLSGSKYISPKYSLEKHRAELSLLGVKDVTPEEFLKDLEMFIKSSPENFQTMPQIWHSRLCKLLYQFSIGKATAKEKVAKLEIIPLNGGGGKWISSSKQVLYFSDEKNKDVQIPNGIEMKEINFEAASDCSRRNLYTLLGARAWTNEKVCQAIISTHSSSSFLPLLLSPEELISHTIFLFNANWTNINPRHLWLLTESGAAKPSIEAYIDSDKTGSASTLFGQDKKLFSFIHSDYSMKVPLDRQPQLRDWMVANLGVAEFPRLISEHDSNTQLNEDFQFLLQNSDYISVLLLLRDNWNHYAKWITKGNKSTMKCTQKVRRAIGSMPVSCKGGGSAKLRETILPTLNTDAKILPSISFLEIPDPEHPQWKQLHHFGVVVIAGIGPFIKYLEILKNSDATLEKASELYKQIYTQCNLDPSLIRACKKSFESETLILMPKSEDWTGQQWLSLQGCVWEGPACLKKVACLSKFYPEHYSFFSSMLDLGKADWTTLTDEAQMIKASDPIEYISEIFKSISDHLQTEEKARMVQSRKNMIEALTKSTIFPVDEGKSGSTFDYLSTSQTKARWFIADRSHFKYVFQGHVPLLALNEETIEKIGPLVTALGWDRRLLSRVACGFPDVGGNPQLNDKYTRLMCTRARFIARLIPPKLANRKAIIEQLFNLKVYTVRRITIKWIIKVRGGEDVEGRADSGRVKITAIGDGLEVFLRKSDSDVSRPPLELLEELAAFCRLTEASQVALLHAVMNETYSGDMEVIFNRRGLHNDVPEFNTLKDSKKLNPELWSASETRNPGDDDYWEEEDATFDAVLTFMERFTVLNQWDNTRARPWAKTDTDSVLSHLCRLENVNPYLLLPQTSHSPWDRRIRQGGAFLDDPTSISFVCDSSDSGKKSRLRPHRLFPALVEINRGREIEIEMLPDSTVDVARDVILAGELYISKLLESELREMYNPEIHWTSSLRGKTGLSPFTGDEIEASTFTIADREGSLALSHMLTKMVRSHRILDKKLKAPVYHIEVVTTERGITSEFVLEPFQVQKAWRCHQTRKVGRTGVSFAEAFILIRIVNVQEHPQIAIFVDPWQMHATGDLQLTSASRFLADFQISLPASVMWNAADRYINSRETRSSRKRKRSDSLTDLDSNQAGPSSDPQYTYRPLKLKQIRLLELLPGIDDDAIQGLLRHVFISEGPKFRAISYAWGPALKPFNLHTAEGNISLTSPLHAALKRLRSATESTFLWADAICIDQANVYEKAIQIRMLPIIFQSAELVFAWIGSDEDDSYQALETLLQIRTNELKPDVWPTGLPSIPPEWQHPGLPQMKSEVWGHIVVLFQREWFRRAWIIQEIVLASEVKFVCGSWEISWDDIFAAVKICLDWSSTLGVAHNRLREMLSSLKPSYTLAETRAAFKKMKLSPRFNMMALLDEFAYTQSTKECDKLFALLGISSDAETAAFDPDYSSSIETIARRYAAEFINRGQSMDLLYRSGKSKSYSFSSWIPNWTSNGPCRTISTWRGAHGIFSAGGPPVEYDRLDPHDARHLQVTGALIDTVIKIGRNTTANFDLITVINSLTEIIDGLGDYPTGESRQELLLKIPIGNAIKPCEDEIGSFQEATEGDKDPYANFQWNDSGNGIQSVQDIVEFFKQNREEREITWKYWCTAATFLKRLSHGRFFATQRGYIGVGPKTIKVHDHICVFAGGVVPFVLEKGSRTYSLIGECYVHGIMYGESSNFTGIRQEQFVLK